MRLSNVITKLAGVCFRLCWEYQVSEYDFKLSWYIVVAERLFNKLVKSDTSAIEAGAYITTTRVASAVITIALHKGDIS